MSKRKYHPFQMECPICGHTYIECANLHCDQCIYLNTSGVNWYCKLQYEVLNKCKCSKFDQKYIIYKKYIQLQIELDNALERLNLYEEYKGSFYDTIISDPKCQFYIKKENKDVKAAK